MEVLSAQVRFAAVAMTKSSGVTDGLFRYLCLKNPAPKICIAQVAIDQNFQYQQSLVDMPRTNTFLQFSAQVQRLCGLLCTRASILIGMNGC
jgi:hypothetical protein